MKKILISIIMVLVLLTGCGKSNLKNINFNELKEKINNKDSFVVYFSGNDSIFKDKLNSISNEYDLTIYVVNKVNDNDKNDYQTIINIENESIVFILNGQDPSKLSHITDSSVTKKQIIQRLKDMNFIKE